ncbi:YceI family protein [Gilvimarinus sp. DA14]|uniref:YceI family protein n=1 Tax=Gilvimarinus sp. DA14 TaxID=2956798 RepID=UPI0020B647DA|nr:YceI family protein [Gilvimarinus sp. DA14]UTF60852.1 YceI family protein [Gilvimarinus sp. DA14]
MLSTDVETDLTALKQGNYSLDPKHTSVLFKVSHLNVSEFVGRFNQASAELDYVPEDPAASRIRASVNMQSLDVNNPDFAETLKSCDWLCADTYPQALFVSDGRAERDGNTLIFRGTLQFRGVTQSAQLDVRINGATTNRLTGDYIIGFAANLSFKRSAFDMGRFVPAVGDDIDIEIHAEFIRN